MLKKLLILLSLLMFAFLLFANAGNLLIYTEGDLDRVTTTVDINPSVEPVLTMSAWVYPVTGSGGRHQVLSHDDGGYDRSLLRENDSWGIFTGSECWLPGPTVQYNQWQHVAIVYSSTDIKFYLNGTEYSYGSAGNCGSSGNRLMIGCNPGYGEYWNGKIDEVRIWGAALSQQEIQDWMDKPLNSSHPNWSDLIAYWKCDEGSGQEISDSSGNGNTGILGTNNNVETQDPAWDTSDAPLPVVLSDFYANYQNDNLSINWITASEINLAGFNIYKNNAKDFSSSYKINPSIIPAHNNSLINNYSFTDNTGDIQQGQTYYYWLESLSYSGESQLFGSISIYIPQDSQNDSPQITSLCGITSIFPNPFNPSASIKYKLSVSGNAKLEIFNFKGELIRVIDLGYKEADKNYSIVWDGKNAQGKTVASGIYNFRLVSPETKDTKKAILLK